MDDVPEPLDLDPTSFQFVSAGALMATLRPDGSIEFGPGYEPCEAARTFWEHLASANPLKAEVQRLRAENDRLTTERSKALAGLWRVRMAMEAATVDEDAGAVATRIVHLAEVGMAGMRRDAQDAAAAISRPGSDLRP